MMMMISEVTLRWPYGKANGIAIGSYLNLSYPWGKITATKVSADYVGNNYNSSSALRGKLTTMNDLTKIILIPGITEMDLRMIWG